MKKTILIYRWELKRVVTNWRQAMSVFIIPSIVLLVAVYAFPFILSYLSTGTVGRGAIYLVNPDEGFVDQVQGRASISGIQYVLIGENIFGEMTRDGSAAKEVTQGSIFAVFSSFPLEESSEKLDFSQAVRTYYLQISKGNPSPEKTAFISTYFDETNMRSRMNLLIFESEIKGRYSDYLLSFYGNQFPSLGGGNAFNRNAPNPYTTLMNHRSDANPAAGRVLPGVLILLIYYSVYSLSADTVASDRQRGFLATLSLTPVGAHSLVIAKGAAVTTVASASSMITLIIFVLSSWINFSDAPNSLLPFGLILFPGELTMILGAIFSVAMLMTAYCFVISMTLKENQDILLNLQIPLIFFLVLFFAHLFRFSDTLWGEYFVPVYGTLVLIRDVFNGTQDSLSFALVLLINLSLSVALFTYSIQNFSPTAATISEKRRPK